MNHMNRLVVIASLLVVAVPQTSVAASRNCKAVERDAANSDLLSIQGNSTRSQELVELHLPFGTHVPQGAPIGERLLVQGGYVSRHDDDLLTTLWVGYRLNEGKTLRGLGLVCGTLSQAAKATEHLKRAIRIGKEIKDPEMVRECQGELDQLRRQV